MIVYRYLAPLPPRGTSYMKRFQKKCRSQNYGQAFMIYINIESIVGTIVWGMIWGQRWLWSQNSKWFWTQKQGRATLHWISLHAMAEKWIWNGIQLGMKYFNTFGKAESAGQKFLADTDLITHLMDKNEKRLFTLFAISWIFTRTGCYLKLKWQWSNVVEI